MVAAIESKRLNRPREGPGSWPDILARAAEIVHSYDTAVTLRQVFYRLVAAGVFENRRTNYDRLCSRTAQARWDGDFPDLIDPTRTISQVESFEDVDAALEDLAGTYRRDRTEGQEHQIWIGVEKRTMIEQLWNWFGDPLGLPVVALGGYVTHPIGKRIIDAVEADGRPAVLLYAGDFDATGHDIVRNIKDRLGEYFVDIQHVAILPEHLEQYDLEAKIGKDTDSRKAAFMLQHGQNVQVELEALPPEAFRALYQAPIDQLWSKRLYDVALVTEVADRKVLRGMETP